MTLLLEILAGFAAQAAPLPPAAAPAPPATAAVTKWPSREADFTVRDFRLQSGERLPVLRIHYTTLGRPQRDARGEINNAVMILHGTGGTGKQFLQPQFADELFGPGQPLDISRYWIILPDNIGHGRSSKPSDGLRTRFPAYDYDDMVEAQHQLLSKGLGIRQMRLIMGTSMGCMHSFVWGETRPDFARALMPLACQPVEIGGLNRMWRQLLVDGIKADPAWAGGNYKAQPLASLDANDLLYQVESSRTYDPWPKLEAITASMTWINSADDFINPRNLDIPQRAIARMPNARFRMIAESSETRGHGTHTWARFWKADLADLIARTER
jgi:homoserine O-acetyltransferase